MKSSSYPRATVVAAALTVLVTACDPGPVVTQDTQAGEDAYRKHARKWLEWVSALPWSTGPVTDPTGDQCALGQSGKVWYLAGTSGGPVERSCDIPANKFLFFPLENIWSAPPAEFVDTDEELQEFIDAFAAFFPEYRAGTCALTLRLDGEELVGDLEALDEELYVSILDPFELELNDDNANSGSGMPGGTVPAAVTAGHFALLWPLEPGDHVLEFGGTICDEGEIYFETSAVYNLHVDE